MNTDEIQASKYRPLIEHKLSANVQEARYLDTTEDSFIHVFRSLHNKSLYTPETEDIHLTWIRNTYGGQRIAWILSNRPLMGHLKDLMQFDHFEQEGKVPVTLYHSWSTHPEKGSVSDRLKLSNNRVEPGYVSDHGVDDEPYDKVAAIFVHSNGSALCTAIYEKIEQQKR